MRTLFFKKLGGISMLIGFLLIYTTCEINESVPTFTDQGEIGPEGGVVKTSDGASVEIPAGALSNQETISITNITDEKRVINNECEIYEMEPDGLTFNDSITITLPFNDDYVDLFTADDNYGISIMVLQDSIWEMLNPVVDLDNKTAKVKTTHFSMYRIDYPSEYSDYFFKNKSINNEDSNPIRVPFYCQDGYTCSHYSLSMLTRYSGYEYKAPYFLSLMDKGDNEDKGFLFFTGVGLCEADLPLLNKNLAQIGIEAEIAQPTWFNIYNLSGYILEQLNNGYPVYVGSIKHKHAFVVAGHDSEGFFINDPSGVFLKAVFNVVDMGNLGYVHVSYDQFHDCLKGIYTDCTIIIKSQEEKYTEGVTMNFHESSIKVFELDNNHNYNTVGGLDLNGKYKPLGYNIVNTINPTLGFDGFDYLEISPIFANTDSTKSAEVLVYCKIDGKDAEDSPILLTNSSSPQHISIPPGNTYYHEALFMNQLSNLSKGTHILSMTSKSVDSQILYDSWEFEFEIENEYNTESSDIIFNPDLTYGSVTDIDGNVYKTIQIGTQTWMAENLKTSKLNSGTNIQCVSDAFLYYSSPRYCWYDNDMANNEIYGALYNGFTVNTGKLCPTGWHVSTKTDWNILSSYLGGYSYSGGKLKEVGTTHWYSPNVGATNESGFTALPGGRNTGSFNDLGECGAFWTSTTTSNTNNKCNDILVVGDSYTATLVYGWALAAYFSVRCVKD